MIANTHTIHSARLALNRLIDKSGDCWIWRGNIGVHGYGRLWVSGKLAVAHRLTYAIANAVSHPVVI